MKKRHRNLSAQQLVDCYNTTGSTLGWRPLSTEQIIQANERLRDTIVYRCQKNFEVLNQIEININQYGIQNDNPLPSYHKNLEKPTAKTQSDAKRSEVLPLENKVLSEVRHLRKQMQQVLFHLNSKTEREKFHSQKRLPKDEKARLKNLEEAVCGLVSSLDHQLLPYLEQIDTHKK